MIAKQVNIDREMVENFEESQKIAAPKKENPMNIGTIPVRAQSTVGKE